MEIERPAPGPGEVLLHISSVGICGSDIHLYRGDNPYTTYPRIYGHEFSATISRVGEGVENLKLGAQVVVEPLVYCGTCYPCRIGRHNCCTRLQVIGVHRDGGLVDEIVVPAERVFSVPDDMSPQVAAMCEPFSIGMQAVSRGAITADDRVVILGAGPIGLTILAIAKARGVSVLVSDLLDSRLELARSLGADVVVNGGTTDARQAVMDFTDGEGASVVVEATGSTRAMESTVDLVAFAGRIVLVGVTTKPVTFPGLDFTRKELTILGSRNNASQFDDAVRFVIEHPDVVQKLITQQFAFDDVAAAFEMADTQPEHVCKIVVNIGAA
jgi:2-desacetyl-2-hydroxyethyl bacteriochlorophyllide A dehydrogenase